MGGNHERRGVFVSGVSGRDRDRGIFGVPHDDGVARVMNDRRRVTADPQRDIVVIGKLMAWKLEMVGGECNDELARMFYDALGRLRSEVV